MSEHDAKTPTDGASTLPSPNSVPGVQWMVAHLLGGETVIGKIVKTGPAHIMERPYQIMVMPSEKSNKAQITLIKYGSMLGLMNSLALNHIALDGRVMGFANPDAELMAAYVEALRRELEPVQQAEVDALIKHPGAA